MNFYRIQSADRNAAELLDPSHWISRQWFTAAYIDCADCTGTSCENCDGEGEIEDTRHGISACDTVEDLIAYFGQVGGDLDNTVIIEMRGYTADDEDHDAHLGAILVHPTEIVAITPVDDTILARIYA